MPTWLIIVLVAFALLVVGGIIARGRQLRRSRPAFDRSLEQVNRDLATAALEEAARRIYASERGGDPPDLLLVEVRDRPGTDEDQAVFRCGSERLTLGRRDGEWIHESLA